MTNDKVITKQDLYRDGIWKKQQQTVKNGAVEGTLLPLGCLPMLLMCNALFTYEEYQEFITNFLQNE